MRAATSDASWLREAHSGGLLECAQLRVKDVDVSTSPIAARSGKGDRDRSSYFLPPSDPHSAANSSGSESSTSRIGDRSATASIGVPRPFVTRLVGSPSLPYAAPSRSLTRFESHRGDERTLGND